MSSSALRLLLCGPVLAALTLSPFAVRAATLTWDGDTSANFSGSWESGVNWSTNAVPGAADIAQLLDVTSGTRTVTISSGSPQTINRLVITQTTAGAFNVLNVDDNLTISGNATPFAITATAGQDSIVTNIAANKTLLATHTSSITSSAYAGTLNLAAGSLFKLSAIAANADLALPTFSGPINATGAGAQIVYQRNRNLTGGSSNYNGAVKVTGSGSSLTLSSLSAVDAVTSIGTVNFSGNDGSGNSVAIDTGAQFNISGNGGIYNFTNRLSLGGAATQFAITSTSTSNTSTVNFNGGLTLGAGALVKIEDSGVTVTHAGTSTLGTGSELRLKFTGPGGSGQFTNNGTLTLDGAALNFDYAAASSNNGIRAYNNTGTMTLKNSSSLALISSTGRSVAGGFGNFRNTTNTGTLSVQSGSTIGFESLLSTGTLNLGSSTSGVSDTQVSAGSPLNTFTDMVLNNGYTTGNATLNVLGNTFYGRATTGASGTAYLDNGTVRNGGAMTTGTDSTTGSTINVGDGSTAVQLTVGNMNSTLTNATGNTINLKSNATLLLKSMLTTTSTTGTVTFTNNGTLNHTGTLSFQGNFNGARTLANGTASTHRISGQNAVINSLAGNGSGSNAAAITFTSSGRITGNSAFDKLTYTNSTGNASFNTLALTMSGGEITAGNGTNGSGASSIGTLEFVNTNITLTGATKLSFDIGGLGNDEAPLDGNFDPILTFDRILLGASRTFALGTGAVLDIWMTNGFVTETAQTYTLIDTGLGGEGTISGSFATLLFQGQALDDDQYTVSIANGAVSITLAAGLGSPIPEPSTYALLAAAAAAGAVLLRRRRCV